MIATPPLKAKPGQPQLGGVAAPPPKAIAAVLKRVIEDVYTSGITKVLTFDLNTTGSVVGRFHDESQVYDYEIKPNGEISYIETEVNGTRSDSFLLGYYVDAGRLRMDAPTTSSRKAPRCARGKRCGGSCIEKGDMCRSKLSPMAMTQMQQVKRAIAARKGPQEGQPQTAGQVQKGPSPTKEKKSTQGGKEAQGKTAKGVGKAIAAAAGIAAVGVAAAAVASRGKGKTEDRSPVPPKLSKQVQERLTGEVLEQFAENPRKPKFHEKLGAEIGIQVANEFAWTFFEANVSISTKNPGAGAVATILARVGIGKQVEQHIRDRFEDQYDIRGFDSGKARFATKVGVRAAKYAIALSIYSSVQAQAGGSSGYDSGSGQGFNFNEPAGYKDFKKELDNDPQMRQEYAKAVAEALKKKPPGVSDEVIRRSVEQAFYGSWKVRNNDVANAQKRKTQSGKNWFDVLGVDPNAPEDEIKAAFRRLSRQSHPDLNPNDPKAGEKFSEIAEAWEIAKAKARSRQDSSDAVEEVKQLQRQIAVLVKSAIATVNKDVVTLLGVRESGENLTGMFRDHQDRILTYIIKPDGRISYRTSSRQDSEKDQCKVGVACGNACVEAGSECQQELPETGKKRIGRVKQLMGQLKEVRSQIESELQAITKEGKPREIDLKPVIEEIAVAGAGAIPGAPPWVGPIASATTRAITRTWRNSYEDVVREGFGGLLTGMEKMTPEQKQDMVSEVLIEIVAGGVGTAAGTSAASGLPELRVPGVGFNATGVIAGASSGMTTARTVKPLTEQAARRIVR